MLASLWPSWPIQASLLGTVTTTEATSIKAHTGPHRLLQWQLTSH
jgi:hypothetical protein